jgi:DNA repair exonuclease SbcCD ATPase subunit
MEEKVRRKQEELTQAEGAANNVEEVESQDSKREKLLADATTQQELKRELEHELREKEKPFKEVDRNIKATQKRKKLAGKELKEAKRTLDNTRNQILEKAASRESEGAKQTEMLKQAEEELDAARAKVPELRQSQSAELQAYEEIEPALHDARTRVEKLQSQLNGARNTMKTLESSSGDSIAILGPRVASVAKMVCSFCHLILELSEFLPIFLTM